jgi:hypothetical protein
MRSKVRSRPLKQRQVVPPEGWRGIRGLIANIAGIAFWLIIGGINAYFSVIAILAGGMLLAQANPAELSPPIAGPLRAAADVLSSVGVAITLHLIGTVVEGSAWRNIASRAGLTFLIVLVLDISTTGWGFSAIAESMGYIVAGPLLAGVWIAAFLIAILPEMMIIRHLQTMGILED